MSSPGESKPPDPRITPIDLGRVVVKPSSTEGLAAGALTISQATISLPRVQPTTSVISVSATPGQSIFTPSPNPSPHLIVPTSSAKSASLRPPIRPLPTTPAAVNSNVQKIMATPQAASQTKTPSVVSHINRAPIIPLQQGKQQRSLTPNTSLIRTSTAQFTTHVPRGPATVANITTGPKTAVATPIIRQAAGGQNVVLASSHIPVGARASAAAALTPNRSYTPVTMVEVGKPHQPAGQLHLGIPPSITIESSVRTTGATTQKQTVYAPAIFQPVVAGDKNASATTIFKATGGNQFSKGASNFTPITTSQTSQGAAQTISNPTTSQAVTIANKVTVCNSNQISNKVGNPVFMTTKSSVGNVVITTSQRPGRNVATTQVTTPTNTTNISIPMTKVFQQPLTVTGSDLETQPQPIGFMTAAGPRLQLPVISVGQSVQNAPAGTVVLTGEANRATGTTQYAVPAGTYLRYEAYTPTAAYFSGQNAAPTPVHLATATIPGVRTVAPGTSFSTAPRPLMVTVDTKVHTGNSNASNNVISVAAKGGNNHASDMANLSSNIGTANMHSDISGTIPRISSETTITRLTTPVASDHSTKLANLTEKVITQALSSPVNPGNTPMSLPVSVTGLNSAMSTNTSAGGHLTNQQGTSLNSSPSRPSILRKRPATSSDHFPITVQAANSSASKREFKEDSSVCGGAIIVKQEIPEDINNPMSLSLSSELSLSQQNGQVSPRKKPRKQSLLIQSGEGVVPERQLHRAENGRQETPVAHRPQLFGGQHGWKARLNHFLRHSDVRCREDKKPSVNELANQKCAAQRAHGWKLYHIKGQVEEVEYIESDVFQRFNKILHDFEASNRVADAKTLTPEDEKMLSKITDLIKGNLQRSKIMQDQVGEVKKQLVRVLDHKTRVLDVIGKHVSKRPLKKREKL